MWAGADWTWHKPVLRNERSRTEAYSQGPDRARDQIRRPGDPADLPRRFLQPAGDKVAEADSWCFRTDRDHARERGTKYTEAERRPRRRYTGRSCQIWRLYADEENPRRGAALLGGCEGRRQAADMVKGPMTVTGFIAFAQGWGGLYIRANKLAWKHEHKHPGLGIKNRFGIPDCPERVHWDERVRARSRRARRLRLRPRALLLADASADELDGR